MKLRRWRSIIGFLANKFIHGLALILIQLIKLLIMDNRNDRTQPQPGMDQTTPKPDPETLHTTDPQENMDGPVSSTLKSTGGAFDTDETKEEADRERDERV